MNTKTCFCFSWDSIRAFSLLLVLKPLCLPTTLEHCEVSSPPHLKTPPQDSTLEPRMYLCCQIIRLVGRKPWVWSHHHWVEWHRPVIPALGRWMEEYQKLQIILSYTMSWGRHGPCYLISNRQNLSKPIFLSVYIIFHLSAEGGIQKVTYTRQAFYSSATSSYLSLILSVCLSVCCPPAFSYSTPAKE